MGLIENETDERDVVAAEAGGLFPGVTVAEESDDGDVMTESGTGLFLPDACFDQAALNFMNWTGHEN